MESELDQKKYGFVPNDLYIIYICLKKELNGNNFYIDLLILYYYYFWLYIILGWGSRVFNTSCFISCTSYQKHSLSGYQTS